MGTTFCVGVVGMYHSGIGGGGFALIRDAKGHYEAIDFRESAPAAAFQDMYLGNIRGSIYGGLSAGVPSEVKGLEYIHEKYGVWSPQRNSVRIHTSRLTHLYIGSTLGDCDARRYQGGSLWFQK